MTLEAVSLLYEGIDAIRQAGGETFRYCYQCGKCDTVCPWNRVTDFSMRNFVRQAAFGVPEVEGTDLWRCTTCGRCTERCPRGVGTTDVTVSFRRIASQYGLCPDSIHMVRASLGAEGNPLREARSNRADWAAGLDIKPFVEGMEILYFPGCYLAYDARMKKVTSATVAILKQAGVDFGILGTKENCCGESIRKTGDEALFKRLARENIKTFIDAGVHKILVSSPHCYHTFKNEYTQFNVSFEVVHISQYLFQLIEQGRLHLKGDCNMSVTYHDPCYLGRHNGIYDEPRAVLGCVPGLKLVEMDESKRNSLCCGGGGGGIWTETAKGERFADLRLAQAQETGASILVTACPYCITNFEESRLALGDTPGIEIKDITEVIQEVI
jgi:Fe-S oxidoreductase